jgi:hypothetical protein
MPTGQEEQGLDRRSFLGRGALAGAGAVAGATAVQALIP